MPIRENRRPEKRPTFLIRFVAAPGCTDPIRSLRGMLKAALRRYRLRAVSAIEERSR